MKLVALTFFSAIVPGIALAQTPPEPASAQGDVAITVYNNNLAMVQDVRQINLPLGRSRQEFPDVSAQIRPATVTIGGEGFGIVEQNFDFDLLSPDKLMSKAVGQVVTIVRTNPATGAETREQAKVLAANGGIVLQIGSRIEVLRDDGLPVRVVFDRVPQNLRARPTLSVTLQGQRAGPRPVSLSYLTPGMGWTADYVALFDEKRDTIDVQGWVTLTNTTGTTFINAQTWLVAGSPSRDSYQRYGYRAPGSVVLAGTETALRERLGDFYVYPIDGRTTVANDQQKQVSFLDAANVPATRHYQYFMNGFQVIDYPVSMATILKFTTSAQGGLGDALPAGTMRFYIRDVRGQPQFIGENSINHTPMGSQLEIRTGAAFDVRMTAKIEKQEKVEEGEWEDVAKYRINSGGSAPPQTTIVQQKPLFWRTDMRYTFTNARPEKATIEFIQAGLSRHPWLDTRLKEESEKGQQIDADRRVWKITVPPNGKTELTVTYYTR